MTVACSDGGRQLTLSPERLDRLAGALGACRIRPGGLLPALWHWTSLAPACVSGSSVRVRLFRAPRVGFPVWFESPTGTGETSTPSTLVQDGQVWVETLTSDLPTADPGAPLVVGDERLLDEPVGVSQLLSLFTADSTGSPANRALGLLAAHRLRRRVGGKLIVIEFNFWSPPGSLRSCRWAAWSDREGRVLFQAGAPDQPVSMTGTAWFGCGPGPSHWPRGDSRVCP